LTYKLSVALVGCFLLLAGQIQAEQPGSGAVDLKTDYLRLKTRFESQVKESEDPEALAGQALESAALAWTLAAAHVNDDPEAKAEWLAQAAAVEEAARNNSAGDLESRHLAALELLYKALREVALYLVTERQQNPLARDLKKIHAKTRRQLTEHSNKPESDLEKRVILSGALINLSAVIVRSAGGENLTRTALDIMRETAEKSDAAGRRADLHYRAKLSLLYAGNLQGLTAMVFLLGFSAGPPLSRDLAALHGTLNRYGPGTTLSQSLSLTWTALAQASLPLAYWLATRKDLSASETH
jgi:hypothetical protein